MRSHFSLSLVCFFYATLHAGLCTRSNQTKERPDKHSSQSTTLNAPPIRGTKKIIPPDSALNPQMLERSPKPTSHHAPSYQTKVIATIDLTGEPEVARPDAKGPNEETEAAKVYSALKQNICNRPPPPQNVRLTDELLHQVAKGYSAPSDHIHSAHDHAVINQHAFITLKGESWLKDDVINCYMDLINQRSKKEPSDLRPKVFGMNTFFYKALSEGGYQKVRKWYKKEDLCAYDIILVPIHIPGHWCLAVVDFRSKSIGYYDSLGGENMACLSALLDYLIAYREARKQAPLNKDEWACQCIKEIPKQSNGYDCGVFVCTYADYIARARPMDFTQEDMPYFRARIAVEVLNGKLM